jgi:hypothetical protein
MRFNWVQNLRPATKRRQVRNSSISVETLEVRAVLSMLLYPVNARAPVMMPTKPAPITTSADPMPTQPVMMPTTPVAGKSPKWNSEHTDHRQHKPSGIVTKVPHFYPFYTGPKWAELNAVKASAELGPKGNFTFTGTNQGTINKAPAVYVWGIDRNGNLPAGPFTARPNIKFDALVVVSLNSSLKPTAKVTDLATGMTTDLSAGSARIHGHTVSVMVPGSLLPSTGLPPSQFRFNYWPEDGGPAESSSVASFAPENTTAQVGMSG